MKKIAGNILSMALSKLNMVMPLQKNSPIENINVDVLSALRYIAKHLNLQVGENYAKANLEDTLFRLGNQKGIRLRKISFSRDWQFGDFEHLLVFDKKTGEAKILLKGNDNNIYLYSDHKQKETILSDAELSGLMGNAYVAYPLLQDEPIKLFSLMKFLVKLVKYDVLVFMLLSSLLSLVALLVPLITAQLVDNVIPSADFTLLWQLVISLLLVAAVKTSFNIIKAIHSIRVNQRSNLYLQASVWDRVLRLPLKVTSKFMVGDLTIRVSQINEIFETILSVAMQLSMGTLIALFSMIALFYFAPLMAVILVGLIVILLAIRLIFNIYILRYQRSILELQGKNSGKLYEFISSINKIKIANQEQSAFFRWSKIYSKKIKKMYQMGILEIKLNIFDEVYEHLLLILIFVGVISYYNEFSIGQFIAFTSIYAHLFTALNTVFDGMIEIVKAIPVYERVQPLLHDKVEPLSAGIVLQEVTGEIEVADLSYAYPNTSSSALSDINLHIKPGSFVALVGPSGSGKSTLIQLLLGFMPPTEGTILFDNMQLKSLNLRSLRRNIGVVLQDDVTFPGTILDNMRNGHQITLQDLEQFAEIACIKDDIDKLPMQWHSILGTQGDVLSEGQRQRLLIARSLVHQPKIIILDEATSAVDNINQESICNNLDKLEATKLVIAHRLTTIRRADYIYVMDQGRIVQAGTFSELSKKSGLFAEMLASQEL